MAILHCECGKRLNAPGAAPGRQGKCPACGARLTVPADDRSGRAQEIVPPHVRTEAPEETAAGYGLAPEAVPCRPPAYVPVRDKRPRRGQRTETATIERLESGGIVRRPIQPETTIRASLRYPLWDLNGLSLLVFLPPLLWLTSLMSIGLIPGYVVGQWDVMQMGALTMIAPMLTMLAMGLGLASLFLGDVVVTSARGELYHPRLPSWKPVPALASLGRWLWAFSCGLLLSVPLIVLRGVPGRQSSLTDWLMTSLLAAFGVAYGQMALIGVLLFEDLRAVNPITVLGALVRVGLSAIPVCLLTGVATALVCVAVPLLFRLPTVWGVLGLWLFWVVTLYLGMVLSRVLGLFYYRNAARVGWFPDRPRWGA